MFSSITDFEKVRKNSHNIHVHDHIWIFWFFVTEISKPAPRIPDIPDFVVPPIPDFEFEPPPPIMIIGKYRNIKESHNSLWLL